MQLTNQSYHKGFTLIELIVVISIIGILSAIAIPKYLSLGSAARVATIQAAAGSMHSTANNIYAACAITPSCNVQSAGSGGNGLGNSLLLQGQSITLAYGFPRGSAAGIIRAATLDTSSYEIVPGATGTIQVRAPGARLSASCEAEYTQSTGPGVPYTVTITTSGC